jgi:hypothetical protein
MLERIVASSVVVLLLFVSALGAACELSCGFAPDKSDCHTPQAQAQDSALATVKMSRADMPGMAMPEVADSLSSKDELVSSGSQGIPVHAALVDMNTCERQSCDQAQATAGQANCSALHCGRIWAAAGYSYSNILQATFYDARDDVTARSPEIQSPLTISLRI